MIYKGIYAHGHTSPPEVVQEVFADLEMVTFGADLGDGVCPFLSFTSIESDLLTLFVSGWYLVYDGTFTWRGDHFDGLVALKFDTITLDLWSIDKVAISMATI